MVVKERGQFLSLLGWVAVFRWVEGIWITASKCHHLTHDDVKFPPAKFSSTTSHCYVVVRCELWRAWPTFDKLAATASSEEFLYFLLFLHVHSPICHWYITSRPPPQRFCSICSWASSTIFSMIGPSVTANIAKGIGVSFVWKIT